METKQFLSLWYVRTLLVFILVGVLFALVAYTHATWEQARYGMMGPTTITVTGEGEVLARPDIGQFSFSVRAEGGDASTAQEESATKVNAILAYLEAEGIEEKDIKTRNYSLNPKYRYEERICESGSYCPPGERVIDGYEVSQMVEVKVRELEQAGDLISGAGERGATNISSLQFTIDDESNLETEAREVAIKDAQKKAKNLANDLNVRLVRMTGFWEDQGNYPELYNGGYAMDVRAETMELKSPNLPAGENSITSRVNITYEIK